MRQINIEIRNKRAKLTNSDEYLVCGNNDYELVFDFDKEWAKYTAKTALFVFADKSVPVIFEGNICKGVAIEGATECAIGVFAGDIKTTTGAFICCVASIRDIGKTPKAPEPDVYNQIMELLQKTIQAHTKLPTGGKAGQVLKKKSDEDFDTEWAYVEGGEIGGEDGVSPIVTITPIENGNEVTFTDVEGDKTITILNGEKGEKGDRGEKGEQGYTPQRGVDYWTTDDKVEIERYVDTEVENALTTGRADIVKYSAEEPDYSVIGAINTSLLNIDSLYVYISDIENEINGVEEELQMLNEGGIQ